VREGDEVSIHYDPMVAKVIAWGADRLEAIDRLRAALEATDVDGLRTNTRFLWEILGHEAVRTGEVSTRLLENDLPASGATAADTQAAWLIAAAVGTQVASGQVGRAVGGGNALGPAGRFPPQRAGRAAHRAGAGWRAALAAPAAGRPRPVRSNWMDALTCWRWRRAAAGRASAGSTASRSRPVSRPQRTASCCGASACASISPRIPVPSTMSRRSTRATCVRRCRASSSTSVQPGDAVEAGAVLVVLEAMKMEHSLSAPWAGTVAAVLHVKPGDRVEEGAELVQLAPLATNCYGNHATRNDCRFARLRAHLVAARALFRATARNDVVRGGSMLPDGALLEAREINCWRGDRHILRDVSFGVRRASSSSSPDRTGSARPR
jgi:3-methylcrotonyl-CoA carboxylase alpha subunit